ncbi:amidohydrolase family protein [Gracilimonas mengyeensis]|uniref:Imidazolonepropionase n=1 Tax=Gracilimonas mengyeensis TaxID=1302730 RepID=A0A521EPF4_9BACT|nr:amidohydrolase family protein [Gracilimonas mengyeensis]SMO85793.1 Imidazolonepropionase [Gracilimonas mengyeensis]
MKFKALLLSFFFTLLLAFNAYAQRTVIHAGTLIDGVSDEAQSDVSIIIEDNKITAIEDGFINTSGSDQLIDLSDKTVLPGLIDLHVHLESETNPKKYMEAFTFNEADFALRSTAYAKRTLMAGFTTVRELGGSGVNISLRNAINQGFVDGPRVITVGKSLATTGGHADPTNGWKNDLMGAPGPEVGVLNGTAEAREAVRQRYKNGADHIKITATGGVLSVAKSGDAPQFFEDELDAIVQTANEYGMHVAAHAHGAEGMKRAVEAGVLTIEHGTHMTEEVMDLMIEHGTYYVPTISAGKWVAEKAKIDGYYPELVVPKALEIGPKIQNTFKQAYEYGVNIAFGTDAGVFPHGMNGKEFRYMTEAGMPVMEAIKSATVTAATVLGMEDQVGSVESGKYADLIATDKNPLEDVTTLESVSFVMKDGKVYKQ